MVPVKVKQVIDTLIPSCHVVLVDDMSANIETNRLLLIDMGFNRDNIAVAQSGLGAFSKLEGVDLIITDWNMPLVDGRELVMKVREKGFGDPAIVMITAELDKDMHQVEEYVDGFLKKPFTVAQVEDMIYTAMAKRVLRKKQ